MKNAPSPLKSAALFGLTPLTCLTPALSERTAGLSMVHVLDAVKDTVNCVIVTTDGMKVFNIYICI